MIKFFDIGRQYQRDKDVYLDLADQVLSSGQMVNGPHCAALARALAIKSGRGHVVLTGSCTDALAFVGEATVWEDTTVFFPLISFPATDNAFLRGIKHRKWNAEYVDVDYYRLIDLEKLEAMLQACKSAHKIVVWVNLYGNTVNYRLLDDIAYNNNALLIEDAAQSYGANYDRIWSGGMGTTSTLSFDPTKNLNSFGMGGAVLTDDHKVARFVEMNRRPHTAQWINHGHNSQMKELDAAVVLWKLENRFYEWQTRRGEIASYYFDELQEVAGSCYADTNLMKGAHHKYVMNIQCRGAVQAAMLEAGIETKIHYPRTLIPGPGTNAETFTHTGLSLPLYPELSDAEVEVVAEVAAKVIKKILKPSPIVHT